MYRQCGIALLLAFAVPGLASASGSDRMPMPSASEPSATPEQEAVSAYNDGVAYREKADKLEKQAAAEADAERKAKLLSKCQGMHESSIKKFTKAVQNDPRMFQAWGGLGYAYRKTGNYPVALEAYDRALALEKSYTPAIEYRAEAYLGLNRLAESKSAYMTLFASDRARADELAAAMERWVAARRSDPGGVAVATVEDFGKWLDERKQIASQTTPVTDPAAAHW